MGHQERAPVSLIHPREVGVETWEITTAAFIDEHDSTTPWLAAS